MTSYFRNWFGGSSSTASSSKSRSRSAGPPPIYAPAPGSSASANVQRSYSFSASRATNPSPLRYATGTDTRTMHGFAKRSAASPYAEPRANSLRRASYKTREPGKLCFLYLTKLSLNSSASSPLCSVCLLGWAQHLISVTVEFKQLAFRYGGTPVVQLGHRSPIRWSLLWRNTSSLAAEPELAVCWHCLFLYVPVVRYDELSLTENLI